MPKSARKHSRSRSPSASVSALTALKKTLMDKSADLGARKTAYDSLVAQKTQLLLRCCRNFLAIQICRAQPFAAWRRTMIPILRAPS